MPEGGRRGREMKNGSGGAHLGMLDGLWRRGWQGEVLQGWIGPNPGKSRLIQPFAGFLWGSRQGCAGSFASFAFAAVATSADGDEPPTLFAALFVRWPMGWSCGSRARPCRDNRRCRAQTVHNDGKNHGVGVKRRDPARGSDPKGICKRRDRKDAARPFPGRPPLPGHPPAPTPAPTLGGSKVGRTGDTCSGSRVLFHVLCVLLRP